jgi:KipI family sensor histidine kinase inhibitor
VQHHVVGPRALLVDVADAAAAAALARWARTAGVEAVDVVPAATTVLLDGVPDLAALVRLLAAVTDDDLADPTGAPGDARVVQVPVRWDGPDLAFVARHWRVDPGEAVRRLEATELVSAFCGFAPGFAYLAGLPEAWAVPRLDDPRPRVAAGSVALAGPWCSVYPSASPGGWRLVGSTDLALWDVDADPPALLAPGTRVRLVGGAPS